MDKETFSFELVDKDKPEIVIKNSLRQIDEATRGYVKGNIEKYDGQIQTYKKNLGFVIPTLQTEVTIDIQKDLGEQNNEDYKYEVFLTVKGLEHYKYRMMFVNHETLSYPVMIVMNDNLAVEYSGGQIKDIFWIESMKDLEELMSRVINSDTMESLIQKLINESLRQEIKNENVTPSGRPALVNPINNGMDEQEQNGVTVPSNAAIQFAPTP